MTESKKCPFCAETIQAAAVRCRYCRSRLISFENERWHRNHPEARLGGVCAALAQALAVPVGLVRLTFVVFTVFLHIAPLVYAVLWLVIARRPGEPSELEHLLRWALGLASTLGRREQKPEANQQPLAPIARSQPEIDADGNGTFARPAT